MQRLPNITLRRSIKAKLVVGTAAIILGVVSLLTFVTARNSAELLQKESLNQLAQLLNQGVDRLSGFFQVRKANLNLWVANPLANAVVSDPALGSVFVPSLRGYFSDFVGQESWIENIFLLKDEAVVYDDSGTFAFAAGASEALVGLPTEDLTFFNLSTLNPQLDKAVIVIKRQLLEDDRPVPGGYLVLLLNLETVQNKLFGDVRVGESGFLSLAARTDESGTIWIPVQDTAKPERTDFVTASQQGQLLTRDTTPYNSIILDRRVLTDTPLAVVGAASLNDVREPVMDLIYTSVLFGILAAALGIIGAVFFSERLAAPIRELTTRARQFASGEYDHSNRVTIRSNDEIGELGGAFNQMATDIGALLDDLESRVRDRTQQLEAANERLQELDRLKSDFLSTVSHELRTPLTSVLGFARVIARRFHKSFLPQLDQSESKVRRDVTRMDEELGIIIEEGERLTRLINDVLDLTKIESGKLEWQMRELSLADIVQSAVNATASLSEVKGLTVNVERQGEDFRVQGDQDRLIQVVTNLLSNAIKFTEQGAITCTLERSNGVVTVAVQDTGIGIAPEDIDKVFERFKQVGDTLTDKPTGTGLGLPICKEIIEHHDGSIRVESETDQGSTFSFTLPTLEAQVEQAQEPLFPRLREQVAEQLPNHTKDTSLILVVDDDNSIRTLLRRELENAGYTVVEAGDGHQALQLARTQQPDLIVLDIIMPGLNGFDVAAVLKQDTVTAAIPILIVSIVEDREKGYQLGVDSYLTKPIDIDKLLTTVSSLLAAAKQSAQHTKKILVIEERQDTVQMITDMLKPKTMTKSYQIISASNAEEGISKARQERPDLIILDHTLAPARVDDIVKMLRVMDETRDSRIIVLTEPLSSETLVDVLPSIETETGHADTAKVSG